MNAHTEIEERERERVYERKYDDGIERAMSVHGGGVNDSTSSNVLGIGNDDGSPEQCHSTVLKTVRD